ncbi:uncharacterized protein YecE (DUF72 family) [Halospina denitrificans]|uniref:Uncharacterized protein YecE (DUF72 family) n=1 Tax=Halospina denitrificans TaxID=332522 RepID=A0A4R7JU63_9GAMM|nr:DUF72 domain-containing protein [Halospina denitrificans]TDT41444.1 uncharacterized protein YecE (DUF72 family) [Halospina denitrificans]
MINQEAAIHIGTSGWRYGHWQGPFYPQGCHEEDWLRYYATRLGTVEINNTFYQLPSAAALVQWRKAVPEGFRFAVKASRYITHMKKLKDPEEGVPNFLNRIRYLEDRLGPVLFQLPPRWRVNPGRLEAFLKSLDPELHYAFEFRDPSWHTASVYDLLHQYRAAFCIYDLAGQRAPEVVTTDFVYVRLHGPDDAYEGCYGRQVLDEWKQRLVGWADEGKSVYVYFDNDAHGYAASNAEQLQALIAGDTAD